MYGSIHNILVTGPDQFCNFMLLGLAESGGLLAMNGNELCHVLCSWWW